MGKMSWVLAIVALSCTELLCDAQSQARLTDPTIELKDNIIHLSYDLLANRTSDYFEVGVDVFDATGKRLVVRAFTGDIGKGVSGGSGKTIQWDLDRDNIVIKEMIYVEVYARSMPQTELVQIGKREDPGIPSTGQNTTVSPSFDRSYSKTYSSAGIVFQSLFIPGLGLSRVTGNPHWVRALAGYGCLAGSVVLNHQSMATYNRIAGYARFDDRVAQLQKSVRQDDISELLALAAIGIWTTDLIWNIVGISSFKKRSMVDVGRVSLRPGFDPLTFAPTVGFKYSF